MCVYIHVCVYTNTDITYFPFYYKFVCNSQYISLLKILLIHFPNINLKIIITYIFLYLKHDILSCFVILSSFLLFYSDSLILVCFFHSVLLYLYFLQETLFCKPTEFKVLTNFCFKRSHSFFPFSFTPCSPGYSEYSNNSGGAAIFECIVNNAVVMCCEVTNGSSNRSVQ